MFNRHSIMYANMPFFTVAFDHIYIMHFTIMNTNTVTVQF